MGSILVSCAATQLSPPPPAAPIVVPVAGNSCPFVPSVADEDKSKISKFGGEVSGGIMAYLNSAKFNTDVEEKLKATYPDGTDPVGSTPWPSQPA
jgi:hypothetical protein